LVTVEKAFPSDEELILKARENDRTAFDILHKRYRERILNYIFRFLGDYQLAEEVTQETFIRVFTHLKDFTLRGRVSSWIYTIATNLAKNVKKKDKAYTTVSIDKHILLEDEEEVEFELRDTKSRPDTGVLQKEFEKDIQKAIEKLPPKYREALILCCIQDIPYKEVAEILRCSIRVVGIRLNRARQMLRRLIKLDLYFEK